MKSFLLTTCTLLIASFSTFAQQKIEPGMYDFDRVIEWFATHYVDSSEQSLNQASRRITYEMFKGDMQMYWPIRPKEADTTTSYGKLIESIVKDLAELLTYQKSQPMDEDHRLYPNPAQYFFNVQFEEEPPQYALFLSIFPRPEIKLTQFTVQQNEARFDLNGIPKGAYQVVLIYSTHQTTHKLIVH